ncbi:hypothetical protein ANRL2_03611 [Anaerolineae bacterium]|nr:hypothetical protein ANRL2_03611 [Anaerolineae bacterium]
MPSSREILIWGTLFSVPALIQIVFIIVFF